MTALSELLEKRKIRTSSSGPNAISEMREKNSVKQAVRYLSADIRSEKRKYASIEIIDKEKQGVKKKKANSDTTPLSSIEDESVPEFKKNRRD